MKPQKFEYSPIKITFKKKVKLEDLSPNRGAIGLSLVLCAVIGLVLSIGLIWAFFQIVTKLL